MNISTPNSKYFLGILTLLTIIIVLFSMRLRWDENSSTPPEIIPSPIQFVPSPVHSVMNGEEIIYISEGLQTRYNSLVIGGGSIMERSFTDINDIQRNELSINVHIRGEVIVGYEGYEWNFENYHIRILEIDEIGFAVIAISEDDNN